MTDHCHPPEASEQDLTLEEAEAVLEQLAGDLRPLAEQRPDPAAPTATIEGPCQPADRQAAPKVEGGPALPLALFRPLLEAIPDALVIVDRAGLIVLVNAQAEAFGYRREELLGQAVELLVPERLRAQHVDDRAGYFAAPDIRPMGAGRNLQGRCKDGRTLPVEISLSPLESEEGLLVLATVRDISERQRTHDQLHKLERRYRTLVEGLPAVTFLAALDDGANELYVSPQIEKLLGFSQEEWLSNPILWHEQLHTDDRDRWHTEFAHTCSSGEPFRSVYRFLARDGRVVWVRGEAQMVFDEDGQPLFLRGFAFDMTDVKEAEEKLEALNAVLDRRVHERTAELVRSNAELDVFAQVAKHELREPLRTMGRFAEMLREQLTGQLDPASSDAIERITNGALRMDRLIVTPQ